MTDSKSANEGKTKKDRQLLVKNVNSELLQQFGNLSESLRQIASSIPEFKFPELPQQQLEQIYNTIQQAGTATREAFLSSLSAKNIIEPLNASRQLFEAIASAAATQIVLPSFYPQAELEVIGKVLLPIRKTRSQTARLLTRLAQCKPGRDSWKDYQTLCCEILSRTLVPPLLDPSQESSTTKRDQRRDLIFHIPNDVHGFWAGIRLTHKSVAVIVECKNYGEALHPNQVTITSKYFGEKRLGLFGIILCRKGLTESAKREQQRLWMEEDKMIVVLADKDLQNLLGLKEAGEDPSKVVDQAIRVMRQSL